MSKIAFLLVCLLVVGSVLGCAAPPPQPPPPAPPPPEAGTLTVEQIKWEISFPASLGNPPKFRGYGWPAEEMIVIEMELPSGVTVPGLEPGERAPLGYGYTDQNGKFEITSGAVTMLFTFFGTYVSGETFKPAVDKIVVLPPGVYTVVATAVSSGASRTAAMEVVTPPEE